MKQVPFTSLDNKVQEKLIKCRRLWELQKAYPFATETHKAATESLTKLFQSLDSLGAPHPQSIDWAK